MKVRSLFLLSMFTLSSQMISATTLNWVGTSSGDLDWSTSSNWNPAGPPVSGDSLNFPAGAASVIQTNNDISSLSLVNITIDSVDNDSRYYLNGNAITLSGAPSIINFNPTAGNMGAQTINLNLGLTAALTLTNTGGSGDIFLQGSISGTGPVTVSDSSVFLVGANTYSGGTVITGGNSILYTTTSALPASGGCSVNPPTASLIFQNASSGTYAGMISGTGNIVFSGNNTSQLVITLSNTGNNYTGTTSVESYTTLQVTTATLPAASPVSLDYGTAILNFNQATTGMYASKISGDGAVLISGGGTVTLSNPANNYSGGTTVSSATLIATTNGDMGAATAPLNLNTAGVLQAGASFSLGRPVVVNGTTSCINPNGYTLIHTGSSLVNATGTGALHIGLTGGTAGTLEVEVPYSYTGGTFLDLGTLLLSGGSTTLPHEGNLTLAASTTFDMSGAGVPAQTVGNFSGAGNTNLGGNSLQVVTSSPQTYSGILSDTGTSQFSQNGPSNLTLTGPNTMTGTISILQGTLTAAAANTLPLATYVVNGTLALTGGYSQTIGSLAGSGAVTLTTGETLTLGGNSNTTTWSGNISGSGSITKTGTGTTTFSGANNYTGGTTVSNGTLALMNGGSLPFAGAVAVNTPATLDLSAANEQIIGNFSGSGALKLGSFPFISEPSANTTFSGTISGTGNSIFDLNGNAILTLSGVSNAWTGNLVITEGTVQAGAANIFPGLTLLSTNGTFALNGHSQMIGGLAGGGVVSFSGGETLTVGGSNNSTSWEGSITGAGALSKTGTGTLTFTQTTFSTINNYTGGTTISDGTLAVTNQSVLSATGPMMITAPGILDVSGAINPQTIGTLSGSGTLKLGSQLFFHEASMDSTFSGTITGPAGSIFDHLGSTSATTLTLSGSSPSWNGELLITTGIVEADATNIFPNLNLVQLHAGGTFNLNGFNQIIGNFAGPGTLDLTTATLDVNSSQNETFSGTISGSAGSEIIYSGGNTLTLSGSSTSWLGTFEVAQGTVKVASAGNLPLATFLVEAPGTLRGVGTVGNINNFGTVHPGLSIGTLYVAGSYVESNTLGIEVNDLGASSSVAITGTLTIDPGSTLQIEPILGKYNTTQTYTVATFASSTGTYSNFFATFPNRFTVSLVYDPTDIKVVLGLVPYASLIPSGNSGAAAACFDLIPGDSTSDAAVVTATLDALSNDLTVLESAFEQLHPSQFSALPLVQENNNILVRSALTRKLNYGRPYELPEVQNNLPPQESSSEQSDDQPLPPPVKVQKGTFWLEGLGKYAHQSHEQHNHGYKAATGGFLLGSDYRFDNTYLGGALGYTASHVSMNSSSGHGNIQSVYGALYGSWFTKMFFVDATVIGSRNYYDAVRDIKFPGLFRRAKNDHKGYQFGGSLGTGMLFYSHHFQLEPFARADYVFVHQQGYKEHGASSLNLHIHQADSRYVRTDLGLKVSRCWSYSKTKLLPYVKLSWIWEDQLDHGHVRSSFESSSCTFIVTGLHPVRSLIAPSLGITTFAYKDAFAFSFHYDAEIGSRFWENRAYLDFAYRY